MPPAFNLRQDQTLQFNTCTRLHSSDVDQAFRFYASSFVTSQAALSATRPASFSMSTSRDASRALKAPSPPAPPESPPAAPAHQSPKATITPSTHTYRLFTLLKSVLAPGRAATPDSVEQRGAIIMIRARHCKHRATPLARFCLWRSRRQRVFSHMNSDTSPTAANHPI